MSFGFLHHPRVYPRTRGETGAVEGEVAPVGSIPAHAGKPRAGGGNGKVDEVYPRTRGETLP